MATLPADRTKLTKAQENQVPSAVASSQRNIDTLTEIYDTVDLLNQKVDNHANAVTLPHADGSVTTAKLANSAVTTPKIADLAVTAAKVANQTLTADKFVPGALTNDTQNALRITELETEFDEHLADVTSRAYNAKYPPIPMVAAVGDGVADDTAALQNINNAAKAAKAPFYMPGGIYKVTALTLDAPIVFGAGWNATEIRGSTASADVVTIPAGYVRLSDIKITSSFAAASRTGSGLRVTGGVQVLVSRVVSDGHRYGIRNQGQGNEFEHCFTAHNNSHGFMAEGSLLPQNEIGIYFCQSNGNGGDGFHLAGPGLGVRMTNPTAASNTGWGINHIGALNDVWITQPEISGNGGGINTVGNSDVQIATPFLETSINQPNLWIESSMTTVTGGFSQGATDAALGAGVLINAEDVTIVGTIFSGNNHCGIRLGGGSSKVTLSGVIVSDTAGTGVTNDFGIFIDAGAGAFTASACDFDVTTPVGGEPIPAGSGIVACKGLPTRLNQSWTANADAAVNGYIEIIDSSGVVRKVATIA